MESGRRHREGCGGERHFGGGMACEVEFFLKRARVRMDGRPLLSISVIGSCSIVHLCSSLYFTLVLPFFLDLFHDIVFFSGGRQCKIGTRRSHIYLHRCTWLAVYTNIIRNRQINYI